MQHDSSSQPTSSSQVVANAGRWSVLQVLGGANVTPGSVASATVSRNNLISSFVGKTPVSRVKVLGVEMKGVLYIESTGAIYV